MKSAVYSLLFLSMSCSSQHPLGGASKDIAATFVTVKAIHHFRDASAMSVDQFRNVYVVESSNNSAIKISPNGDSLHSVSGFGDDHYQFNGPSGIDARLTNVIFISDCFNHRIEQYTKDFSYTGTLYTRDNIDRSMRFGYPPAVAVDDGGNVYVADGENKRVVKARSDFSIERTFGGFSEATRPDAILSNPVALAIDKDEHLIVLDNGGTSLVEYDNLGNFIGRIQLEEKACSICSNSNEIYALIPDGSIVRIFRSGTLVEMGSWKIVRSDSTDASPFESFVVQNNACYLLSRHALYECGSGIGDTTIRN